jgi:hypothetical protein
MHRFQNPVHNIQDIILLVGKTCVSRIEGGEDYLIVMEETGVPGENHCIYKCQLWIQVHHSRDHIWRVRFITIYAINAYHH